MAEPFFATALLTLAEQDALAFRKLADDPAVGDALVGFHAQQAVEKALKAALSHRGVAYRRTHDIAELLDLIADSGISAPPHELRLDELNPYAVHMRYGLIDPTGLDRAEIASFLSDVLEWARDVLRQN